MQGPFGTDLIVEPDAMGKLAATYPVAGLWAFEAARIAAHIPRPGLDTDHRTLPHEIGLIETAVHLNKGCYRGQETVARIQNVGRPPRRLVFLHLDGSVDRLPAHGAPITLEDGTEVGFVGSAARHFELGPIGLGLIKRTVPVDARAAGGRGGRRPGSDRLARRRRQREGHAAPRQRSAAAVRPEDALAVRYGRAHDRDTWHREDGRGAAVGPAAGRAAAVGGGGGGAPRGAGGRAARGLRGARRHRPRKPRRTRPRWWSRSSRRTWAGCWTR